METPKKIAIFIVAYNAAKTLVQTLDRIPDEVMNLVTEIFVFDDHSKDDTYSIGKNYKYTKGIEKLNIYRNPRNLGYGGNQKVGYNYAISKGYDYVVLLHGDGQYAPEALGSLLKPVLSGRAEVVFGSRMMVRGGARKGGMPMYKYLGNIILSTFENFMLRMELSEFHSGYRIYSCRVLSKIPYKLNSDDFHFDTEIIIQLKELGIKILESPIPTYYGDEICYVNGLKYAKNVVKTVIDYKLHKDNLKYVAKYDIAPIRYQAKQGKYSSHVQISSLISPETKVLDVGCGEGFFARLLLAKKCQVVGVDLLKPANPKIFSDYIIADAEKGLNLNDKYKNEFDFIIIADLIEHLKNYQQLLDDIKKYLKPSGQIIISTGNIANWYIRFGLLLGRFNYTVSGLLDLDHVRLYTFKNFKKAIIGSGYKIVQNKVTVIPFELFTPNAKNNWLVAALSRINYLLARIWPAMFAYQFIVVAENIDVSTQT